MMLRHVSSKQHASPHKPQYCHASWPWYAVAKHFILFWPPLQDIEKDLGSIIASREDVASLIKACVLNPQQLELIRMHSSK